MTVSSSMIVRFAMALGVIEIKLGRRELLPKTIFTAARDELHLKRHENLVQDKKVCI